LHSTFTRIANESASTTSLAGISEDIVRDGFAFRNGSDMRLIMRIRGIDSWPGFASSWDDLGLDLYMADGARYRRRRFAAFTASGEAVTRKPHQPHYQSRDHNPLNGGIERWFTPMSNGVIANGFTRGIFGLCTAIFDAVSLGDEKCDPWHVEMHQFRIEVDRGPARTANSRRRAPRWRGLGLCATRQSSQCVERCHPDFRSRWAVAGRIYAH
jgi:hypothetical protein